MAKSSNARAHNKTKSFIDSCIKDDSGTVTLVQWPNGPLFVWLVTRFLIVPRSGSYQTFFDYIAYGALFTWAWLEMTTGVNYFRRLLGVLVLAYLLKSHLP
jgi:hypothetical protein